MIVSPPPLAGEGRERSSPGGASPHARRKWPPLRALPRRRGRENKRPHTFKASSMTPSAPIFPRFSDTEYKRRHDLVRARMAERGLDAVVGAGDSPFRNRNQPPDN